MKKIYFIFMAILTLLLVGCAKISDKDIRNKFIKNVNNIDNYYMEGILKLTNNDDTYQYNVEVSYQKNNNLKVLLENKANNYQQIIVKNSTGVYVINPSLNKSFKFQSDWPGNDSQAYLLDSVKNDLANDEKYQFEQQNDKYIFTTKVDYPNSKELTSQKITLDKDYNLLKVEVLDTNNIPKIVFDVTKYDNKANFSDDYFEIESISEDIEKENNNKNSSNSEEKNTNNNSEEQQDETNQTTTQQDIANTEETMKIDEALFPLYLPNNTSLSQKEVIDTETGQRIIMTFKGDNPFILVQETVKKENELTIIPTYGKPYLLIDTVGSLTDVSYTWTSNGIEYYIVSDVMNQEELLEVARSINIVSVINEK